MISLHIAAIFLASALSIHAMENASAKKDSFSMATYNIGKYRRDSTLLYQYYDINDEYYELFKNIEDDISQCKTVEEELAQLKAGVSYTKPCKKNRTKSMGNKKKRKMVSTPLDSDGDLRVTLDDTEVIKTQINQKQQELTAIKAKKIEHIKKFEFIRQKNYEAVINKLLSHNPTVIFLQEMDCPIVGEKPSDFHVGKIFIEKLQSSGYELLSSNPLTTSDVVTAFKSSDWLHITDLSIDDDKIFAVILQHKLSRGYFAFYNVHLPGHNLQHLSYSFPPVDFPTFPPTIEQYQKIMESFGEYDKNVKATAAKNRTENSAAKLFASMRSLAQIGYITIAGGDFNVDPTKNKNVLPWPINFPVKLPTAPTNIFVPFSDEVDQTRDLRTLDFFLVPSYMYASVFGLTDIPVVESNMETSILLRVVKEFPSDHVPVLGKFDMSKPLKIEQPNCLMQ